MLFDNLLVATLGMARRVSNVVALDMHDGSTRSEVVGFIVLAELSISDVIEEAYLVAIEADAGVRECGSSLRLEVFGAALCVVPSTEDMCLWDVRIDGHAAPTVHRQRTT